MKQVPISSLSEIFCLKSKDKVLVDINFSIRFFWKSALVIVEENKYKIITWKRKISILIKISL